MPFSFQEQHPNIPLSSTQIVTAIEDESSGPTYSVVRLAEALAARDVRSSVMSLAFNSGAMENNGVRCYKFTHDRRPKLLPRRLAPSRALANAVNLAAKEGTVLHTHGLWRMPNVYPGLAAASAGAPLVLSPRGMLGGPALAFSALQKQMFWHLWQRRALKSLKCIHVTAQSELEDVRAFGLTAPAVIIPNGIDVPEKPFVSSGHIKAVRQVLHLGRIHPKKGIDRLLRAWSLIDEHETKWELRIIGPSERGHTEELQTLAKQLNIRNVHFEEPVYGCAKARAYSNADLFVLPTLHENFGMVVAEALAQGTPVISTRGAPWEGLKLEHCGWWVEHGPEALAVAIKEGMELSDTERAKMGARGREWMQRDFSWDTVAQRMENVYRWCAGKSDMPEFVIT